MKELKAILSTDLTHVKTVWFDAKNNWYIHKVPSAVRSMSRDEILKEKPENEKVTAKNNAN